MTSKQFKEFSALVAAALNVSLQWALGGASAVTHLDYMSWHKVPENDPINDRFPYLRYSNKAFLDRTAKYTKLIPKGGKAVTFLDYMSKRGQA